MNDDVFGDDDFDNTGPRGEYQSYGSDVNGSNFSAYGSMEISGHNLPGYLVEALDRFIREGSLGLNSQVPYSAIMMKDVITASNIAYRPSRTETALAAVYKVLDEITGGRVTQETEKIALEERVIMYHYLANFINSLYVELEPYIGMEGYEETSRLARGVRVYYDMLTYHHEHFMGEYIVFCTENELDPDPIVVREFAFGEITPHILCTVSMYKLHNPEENFSESRASLNAMFEALSENFAKAYALGITSWDRSRQTLEED